MSTDFNLKSWVVNYINSLDFSVTNSLVAEKATIAELTVDQLDTSDKVRNYLNNDLSDVNYIKIFNEEIQFITASTDGTAIEQARDRLGNPLYWEDGTFKKAITTVTLFPVMTYCYTELIKTAFAFETDGTNYIPQIVLGAGVGDVENPHYGKGYIYKASDGLYIKYIHSTLGTELIVKLTDNGIDLTGWEKITLGSATIIDGIPQIWVQTAEPTAAKEKDVWIDTDDYSRYDVTALTGTTTLTASGNEVQTCSGTFTVTLPAVAAGQIFRLFNIGTGIITVKNAAAAVVCYLYPSESVDLCADATDWRY